MHNRIFGDSEGENKEISKFFSPPEDVVGPLTPTVQQVVVEFTSVEELDRKYDEIINIDRSELSATDLGTAMLWWRKHQVEHVRQGSLPCLGSFVAMSAISKTLIELGYSLFKIDKAELMAGIYKISLR